MKLLELLLQAKATLEQASMDHCGLDEGMTFNDAYLGVTKAINELQAAKIDIDVLSPAPVASEPVCPGVWPDDILEDGHCVYCGMRYWEG